MKPYLIKTGRMYSGIHFHPILFPDAQSIRFMMDSSCLYSGDFDQLNKIAGISFGRHHRNSVRIAWDVQNGRIRIHAYIYRDGIRSTHFLGYALPGVEYKVQFTRRAIFVSNMGGVLFSQISECLWGYRLYPYFGGTKPAPHDVRIWIKWE